jgi:hypothetical protein
MMVKYEEQTFEHFNVSADARGGSDLFNQNEQQVFSGLGTQPALHGRTYSTTETYAGVVYNMLVTDSLNIQRLPKRRMEKTYKLDLFLQGIMVESISLNFNKTQSLNPLNDANVEKINIETAKMKVDMGMISLDQAAQENGYQEAFKRPEEIEQENETPDNVIPFQQSNRKTSKNKKQTAKFRFDKDTQQYRNATHGK